MAVGDNDSVTLGEIGRSLELFRQGYQKDMDDLRGRMDRMQMVSPAVYAAHREADLRRIEALELDNLTSIQDRKNLSRQLIGLAGTLVVSIIVAVLTVLLNAF